MCLNERKIKKDLCSEFISSDGIFLSRIPPVGMIYSSFEWKVLGTKVVILVLEEAVVFVVVVLRLELGVVAVVYIFVGLVCFRSGGWDCSAVVAECSFWWFL